MRRCRQSHRFGLHRAASRHHHPVLRSGVLGSLVIDDCGGVLDAPLRLRGGTTLDFEAAAVPQSPKLRIPLTPWKPPWAPNGRPFGLLGPPMLSREERNPLSDWWWTVDRPLLGAIMALMLSGIVLSLAASPAVAVRIGLDPFHFFNHHVMFLLPSFIVMIGVSFMSPRQIRRSALIVFAVSIDPDRRDAADRARGEGLAALDHAARPQHPGLRIRKAVLCRGRGLAVLGIDQEAGNAGDLDGAGAAADAGRRCW